MLPNLTVNDLIKEISKLPTNKIFKSVGGKAEYKIEKIEFPLGPIYFSRNGKPSKTTVATNQLATVALACSNRPNYPLHIDRLFNAGGNTRSALETFLANTPNFFVCYPQRVHPYTGEINSKQRHFMWCPNDVHPIGAIQVKSFESIISEVELDIDFGEIKISSQSLESEFDSIEAKRTHTQMQIALIEIGRALGFRTWIAKNDHHIIYKDKPLSEQEDVIQSLDELKILYNDTIKNAAEFIDCIWFTEDGNRIPAVIEVEHSTGVTSGLTRMSKLKDTMPSINTQYVVVAPNSMKSKVVQEANQILFKPLQTGFMPYSTVQELYGFIQKYQLAGIVDYKFITPFIESIIV